MPTGKGKYDDHLSAALVAAGAEQGALIVINDGHANGFSVQMDTMNMIMFPQNLRAMADAIEKDIAAMGLPVTEFQEHADADMRKNAERFGFMLAITDDYEGPEAKMMEKLADELDVEAETGEKDSAKLIRMIDAAMVELAK